MGREETDQMGMILPETSFVIVRSPSDSPEQYFTPLYPSPPFQSSKQGPRSLSAVRSGIASSYDSGSDGMPTSQVRDGPEREGRGGWRTGQVGRLDSLALPVRRHTGGGWVARELGEVLHRPTLEARGLPRRAVGVRRVPVLVGRCVQSPRVSGAVRCEGMKACAPSPSSPGSE